MQSNNSVLFEYLIHTLMSLSLHIKTNKDGREKYISELTGKATNDEY